MKVWAWVLGAGSGAFAGAAVAARDSVTLSIVLASFALVLGLAVLFGLLVPTRRLTSPEVPMPVYPRGQLERSFSSGALGRERIIEAVETVQTRAMPIPPPRLSPDEIRVLQRVDDASFRQWVAYRLDAVESAT